MSKLRVGLVGCSRGQGLVKVFGAHPEVEVTALCDLYPPHMDALGKAFNLPNSALHTQYDRFLGAPLDAVIIATPIKFHAEQTIQALEAGKHVLCEQTMAYSVKDCRRIVNTVKKSKRTYMMAENYCYFHYVREWQKIVEAGKMGKIFYAEGEYLHEIISLLVNAENGKYYWRHDRPPIWYCAHTLGPLLMLMKDRIVKACGLTTGFNKMPKFKKHIGFLDFEIGLFKTQNGSVIKILRSQVVSRPHMVWYSLFGTKGHLENSRLPACNDGMIFIEGEVDKHKPPVAACPFTDPNAPEDAKQGGHGTSEYFMIRDFLAAVKSGKRPPIDAVKAADMTIPGLIAHESAMRGGKWMDVPLMNW